MMPASFHEILNSRSFKFIVGAGIDGNPTEYFVHEDAFANLSAPLRKMMKGNMLEAEEGCTTWKDTSTVTFEKFVQFAYTGDYSIPETQQRTQQTYEELSDKAQTNGGHHHEDLIPDTDPPTDHADEAMKVSYAENEQSSFVLEPGSEAAPEPVAEPEYMFTWDPSTSVYVEEKKKSKKKKGLRNKSTTDRRPFTPPSVQSLPSRAKYTAQGQQPLLAANFQDLYYALRAPRNFHAATCDPAPVFNREHSYSDIFLTHSSLWILGDFWQVDDLKALTLYKLHRTLCIFQLDDTNIGDVLDLARHAYEDEGKGSEEGIGGLRNLVCQYLATNALVLSTDAEFMELLAEGGDLVKDFFSFELQRLH